MLKQLIQRLLDSRTTPAQAAHNASSTYTEPTWFNGTPTVGDSWTDNLYTGTAPSDGYLNVSGSANINTANAGSMIQAKISGAQISQVTPMSGQGFNMMAPISKGATFSVNGICLADITVRFFKSIGGGYNRFVRRALSCLRPSFNYSLRNFLRISLSGLADKHFHPAGSTSLLPSHGMFRQVTASWDFISRVITLTTRLTYTALAPAEALSLVPRFQRRQRTATQSLEQSPLRKVTVLLSAVHSLSYGSHHQWGVNTNLQTGGALC